jgi:hypothetical protein
MNTKRFSEVDDNALVSAALDTGLGLARSFAIEELAGRALKNPLLLADVCAAISSGRRIGFHTGTPLGWLGADRLYLSGQEEAMHRLLNEMNTWEATEQEDLVRHWAGKGRLKELTQELSLRYGWSPRYSQ